MFETITLTTIAAHCGNKFGLTKKTKYKQRAFLWFHNEWLRSKTFKEEEEEKIPIVMSEICRLCLLKL